MDPQRQRWDEYYRSGNRTDEDGWLDSHRGYFRAGQRILDLGSGDGGNLGFLLSLSNDVHACDYSPAAIASIEGRYPAKALLADIRESLPYGDSTFDVVVADLSLHYFSERETQAILDEVSRILKPDGVLLGRVNSTDDVLHGANQGVEIERNFFDRDGIRKRFFDIGMIHGLFGAKFEVVSAEETRTRKYRDEKAAWEFVARNARPSEAAHG